MPASFGLQETTTGRLRGGCHRDTGRWPLAAGPVPADEDLDASFVAPGAEVLRIVRGGERVGGVVAAIDATTQHDSLELLFLSAGARVRGTGQQAGGRSSSATRPRETYTPYFKRRNIHSSMKVCGFKAIEFFSAHHLDTYGRGPGDPGATPVSASRW